jgi:hypothetical protein
MGRSTVLEQPDLPAHGLVNVEAVDLGQGEPADFAGLRVGCRLAAERSTQQRPPAAGGSFVD